MATQLYDVFFGATATGGTPTFSRFVDNDTNAPLTPPTFTERGGGVYQFAIDWGIVSATNIEYVASLTIGTIGFADQYGALSGNAAPGQVTAAAGTQDLNLYESAGVIVSRAAVQLGISGPIADAYASTDPNVLQLCEFLRQACDDVNVEHDWTNLVRPATFVTDGVSASYALPADFHELVDDTLWNRTTRLPGAGPLSQQQVAALQARLVNVVLYYTFQVVGGLLVSPVVPPGGHTIAFLYVSTYCVQSQGSVSPDKDTPSASTDIVLYDPDLMLAALKLRYCEEKGIGDVLAMKARYDEKLEHAIGKNDPGPILTLGGMRHNGLNRPIDGANLPPGNWGLV